MYKHLNPKLLGLGIAIPFMQILPVLAQQQSPTPTPIQTPTTTPTISPQDFAKDRIVSIETRTGQGSGVIIKHVGNTYTILTAAHVVNDLRNSPLTITTPDLQPHPIDPSQVKLAANSLDLASITFQSDRNYTVAHLGDSHTVVRGQHIFVAGFQAKSLKFAPGTIVAISHQPQARGYGIALGNATILPGMSGGGLFNTAGSLIGINGRSVGTTTTNATPNRYGERVKPVSGLAIPIDTFAQIASQLNVEIEPKPPKSLSSQPKADDFFITAQEKSQKGDYQGAIADYNRALVINPQFEEIYFRRGLARSLTKDWQGAEADYTRAIEINPQHPEAYLHRGSIRNALSNWQGAKSDFDIAAVLNPNISSIYVGRGVALCQLRNCQSGLKDYDRAISLNPADADAYTRRAFAYHQLGNNRVAVENYIAAAELYQKQGKDVEYFETVKKIKQLVKG
jgi:S1-C subfamily serine protease/Tfp pilus assembly protein PilF